MKKEIGLRDLSKDELIALFGRRGATVDQRDLRLVRHEHLCKKADQKAIAASARMHKSIGDSKAFDAASREFDRAMRLYDLASEVLCRGPKEI